jgi:hypothetical protein
MGDGRSTLSTGRDSPRGPDDASRPDPRLILEAHLEPAEKVLWAERPETGLSLEGFGLFQTLYVLFLICFGTFWFSIAWRSSGFSFFTLAGVFVFGMIALQLFWPYVKEAFQRSNAVYGITDKRSIIVLDGRSQTVRWQDHTSMPIIEVKRRQDGSGSILFGEGPSIQSNFRYGWMSGDDRFGFRRISDVGQVATVLRQQARG